MTKTPSQVKNIVEDWIKITNAKFQDITQEEKPKQPRLEWIFKVNEMMAMYMIDNRHDRVTFDVPINFAEEHQKATSKMADKDFLEFLTDILEPLTIAGISAKFQQNEKEIRQISLQIYVDTESLEREKFFRRWDRIVAFREIIIKKVQTKLGVSGMTGSANYESSEKGIYG